MTHLAAANDAPTFNPRTATLVVGQRFSQGGFNGSGPGTIVAIHGEQRPATIERVAGVYFGGGAYLDLVYDDGTRAHRVPEAIIRALPYTIKAEVVSADEVAQRVAYAECCTELARRKAERAKATFEAEVVRLLAAPEYADYARGDSSREAISNMRKELRKAFPKVKFSVRMARGGCSTIYVRWSGGPSCEEVERVAYKFKLGSFDGMTDSYNVERRPWTETFGGAYYIFCEREKGE